MEYIVGEALDIIGLVVTGTYSDGSTKVETITDTNVTGFNSSEPVASQILTVTVGGKTTTYTVEIKAAQTPTEKFEADLLTANDGDTITLTDDVMLTLPLKLDKAVTIDGEGKTLTITGSDAGSNTAEGLGIFKDGVVLKNITILGKTHEDNLIEIYSNATLENVTVTGGNKAGIYVNNDKTGTITVNFNGVHTSNNGWDAGIGLAAKLEGSKVIANFSGDNTFGESVAVYHEGTTYPGTYMVTGLVGYTEKTVGKQQKWMKEVVEPILKAPTEGLIELSVVDLQANDVRYLVYGLNEEGKEVQKIATLAEVKTFIDTTYTVTFNSDAIIVEDGKVSINGSILSTEDWNKVKESGNKTIPYKITVLNADKASKVAKIAMYQDGIAVLEDL